jgi:hypothetical protein
MIHQPKEISDGHSLTWTGLPSIKTLNLLLALMPANALKEGELTSRGLSKEEALCGGKRQAAPEDSLHCECLSQHTPYYIIQ